MIRRQVQLTPALAHGQRRSAASSPAQVKAIMARRAHADLGRACRDASRACRHRRRDGLPYDYILPVAGFTAMKDSFWRNFTMPAIAVANSPTSRRRRRYWSACRQNYGREWPPILAAEPGRQAVAVMPCNKEEPPVASSLHYTKMEAPGAFILLRHWSRLASKIGADFGVLPLWSQFSRRKI